VNPDQTVDEKLAIVRLKQGDLGGLETLVYLYQLQAIRTVGLITGDGALAEDIVQSAYIRAAEKIGQFDDRRSFWPWFLRSVVHDAIKAGKRQQRLISLDVDESEGGIDLDDPAPLPEESVEQAETAQAVRRALEKLPPNQRAAIALRYYLGMGEAEIAEALHSPAGTVKWWLFAARLRLARLLHPFREAGAWPTGTQPTPHKSDLQPGDQ
jgi:RNA polymerase sigma-70 factor (ECF subfamily)